MQPTYSDECCSSKVASLQLSNMDNKPSPIKLVTVQELVKREDSESCESQIVDNKLNVNQTSVQEEYIKVEVKLEPSESVENCTGSDTNMLNLNNVKYEESIDIDHIKVESTYEELSIRLNRDQSSPASDELKQETLHSDSINFIESTNSLIKSKTLSPSYYCKYCYKAFSKLSKAKSHMKNDCKYNSKNKIKNYCKLCDTKFANKFSYDRHRFFAHSKNQDKSHCTVCRVCFKDEEDFKKHVSEMPCKKSYGGPSECKKCGKKYKLRSGLMRHLKNECDKPPPFACAHCDLRSAQKANLIKHLARKHNIPEKLSIVQCSKCNKIYKNHCTLRRHVELECGQKPKFCCKFCSYGAKRKYSLKLHLKNKHKDIENIDLIVKEL